MCSHPEVHFDLEFCILIDGRYLVLAERVLVLARDLLAYWVVFLDNCVPDSERDKEHEKDARPATWAVVASWAVFEDGAFIPLADTDKKADYQELYLLNQGILRCLLLSWVTFAWVLQPYGHARRRVFVDSAFIVDTRSEPRIIHLL